MQVVVAWWDGGGEGRGAVNKGEAGGIMDTWGTVIGPQVDAVRGPVTPALERFYTFRFFFFFTAVDYTCTTTGRSTVVVVEHDAVVMH
jgi:hypothetical protein